MTVLGQYRAVLVSTCWYWVSRSPYWSIVGGAGSVWTVLIGTWWYWVSMERNWLIHDDIGSEEGGTGWYLVVLSQYNLVLLGIKWY